MRVIVLVHEDLVPQESGSGSPMMKTERDVTGCLRNDLGHEVRVVGLSHELAPLKSLVESWHPDIVFNLLEEFAAQAIFDQNIVAYLELEGIKYTGCNARGMTLARDKSVAKKILKFHGVETPDFWVFRRGQRIRIQKDLPYPLIVKTLNEEASMGITQRSVVSHPEGLEKKIQSLFDEFGTDALVEEYIDGREFYVAVWGNQRPKVLGPRELVFGRAGPRVKRIASERVKFDARYQARMGVETRAAQGLEPALLANLKRMSLVAHKELQLTGYSRMDFRANEEGRLFFLEANPNPDIARDEDFAEAAREEGLEYPDLIRRILQLGLSSRRP